MRRTILIAAAALLGLTAAARADGLGLHSCCPTCYPIPCPECPDCSCPCDHRLPITLFGAEHAQCLIEALQNGNACERLKAVQKLGHRLHADFCCNPCVLEALVCALECDPCWEVRRAAAWAIFSQGARTEDGVLALYIASKADTHYLVRDRAAEALGILTLCRAACYKELYERGDKIVKYLKDNKWRPGADNCRELFVAAFAAVDVPTAAPAPAPEAKPVPEAKPAEKLPSPKTSLLEPAPAPIIAAPVSAPPPVTRDGTYHILSGGR
jgi:HEAT repeat protein